ncbi:hypothetical protein M408DRAFT_330554 [Serendipita vermifera MAFF 305830]|uniref:Nudix hydrolase domain-containing protein n=1 Tax=Serendipita vermifera MAFF 305830 TaxID=933852 RepID=A0A0C3B378_SERVB|nr:hypothetical protein M408DRAFT_330554 [Serendipita vermifera MAFF 305830]
MSRSDSTLIPLLASAVHSVRTTPPRIIASPPTQPRRAAVALVLRVVPPPNYFIPEQSSTPAQPVSIQDFFELDWVNAPGARAEILYLRRTKGDTQPLANGKPNENGKRKRKDAESHVAFPGGRMEDGDEDGLYTAMRQTWEEIGLDLAERSFTCVGQLDDREITTSLGKRLLMVLSPYVFLQLVPHTQPTDPPPETTLHWTPLSTLVTSKPAWSNVTVDISSRLAPKDSVLRTLVQLLVGTMRFDAIVLNSTEQPNVNKDGWTFGQDGLTKKKIKKNGSNFVALEASNEKYEPANVNALPRRRRGSDDYEDELRLWGLTLGMTMDLMSHMKMPFQPSGMSSPGGLVGSEIAPMATSMTSVFPRFSYPDVNFWIWVFGKRYRQIIHGWEESMSAGGTNDRRINWTGSALQAFYAAVRKALVVVIVLRALGILTVLGISGWWLFYRP